MNKQIKNNDVDEKYYKLYAIDEYKGKTAKFINTQYVEYTLDELTNELETSDKGYHMRISPTSCYIFFGDCDGFNGSFKGFARLLKEFLASNYKIRVLYRDILYTENKSKSGSFHYSIPKIYGSCKKLKEIHENFYKAHLDVFCYKNENGKDLRVVDTSIYSSKWFRYPEQSKEGESNTAHIIINGSMSDFVVDHIPKSSKCIDDISYCDEKQIVRKVPKDLEINPNNSVKKQIVRKVPKDLEINLDDDLDANESDQNTMIEQFKGIIASPFREDVIKKVIHGIRSYDDYNEWLNVGMALKNESNHEIDFFDLWDLWSKQSDKYDGTIQCKKKWKGFKKMRGYSLEYLMSLLKIQSPDTYSNVKKIIRMQKVIKDNGRYYPKNKCMISKLNSTSLSHNIIFTDSHCPINADNHNDPKGQRFFEITKDGTACMKCTHQECIGKICPVNGIELSKNLTKILFMNNNIDNSINNNINITNNYRPGSIFDVRSILGKDIKIFEDPELDRLVTACLYENDADIIDTIIYVNPGICYFESSWYVFNILWEKSDDTPTKAIDNFVLLFDTVKKFVMMSTKIFGVEKREYIDQINKFCRGVKIGKQHKYIIEKLARKLTKKRGFDLNLNLIGFSNGVYDFDKMEFRKGTPEDMIRLSCGYDYSNEYDNKQNIINVLSMIFPDENSIDFYLSYVAASMCGKNNSQLLMVLKWENIRFRNVLLQLMLSTFGEYYYKVSDLSLIAEEENTKDISHLKSVRFVVANSADTISGNEIDKFVTYKRIDHKNNNKHTEKFDINFCTICVCNNEPNIDIDVVDNTVMINIKHNGYKNMKHKNNDFFLLLLEQLEKCKKNNFSINKNQIVKNGKSDEEKICCEFMKECIQKSNNRVTSAKVYKRYIEWSSEKETKMLLTKQRLFSEIKKTDITLTYKRTLRIDDIITCGFIGMSII